MKLRMISDACQVQVPAGLWRYARGVLGFWAESLEPPSTSLMFEPSDALSLQVIVAIVILLFCALIAAGAIAWLVVTSCGG